MVYMCMLADLPLPAVNIAGKKAGQNVHLDMDVSLHQVALSGMSIHL